LGFPALVFLIFSVLSNAWAFDVVSEPIIKSNNFFISSQVIPTGILDGNEGALARAGSVIFVIHRTGQIQTLDSGNGTLLNTGRSIPFQDFQQRSLGERGLPGVKGAFYDNRLGKLLVSSTLIENDCAHLALYSLKVNLLTISISEPKLEFETPDCAPVAALPTDFPPITAYFRGSQPNISQAGGKIQEVPTNGHVLLTIGNFGDDWQTTSEILASVNNTRRFFGKIIELNLANDLKTTLVSIFSTGFRNPSGLSYAPKLQAMVESENGPEGGDELNIISKGKWYGWPLVSLGHRYSDEKSNFSSNEYPPTKQGISMPGAQQPIFNWSPSIAPSNLVPLPTGLSYNIPGVQDVLMGTLRDQSLHLLSLTKKSIIQDERIQMGYRIRDLVFTSDGKTLVTLDDSGNIHLLTFQNRKK
jgi:hypothetical protein